MKAKRAARLAKKEADAEKEGDATDEVGDEQDAPTEEVNRLQV